MRFSTTLALALAPLAMARKVRNSYPANPVRREAAMGLDDRSLAALSGVTVDAQSDVIIIWANPGNGAETTTVNEKVTVTQTVTAGGDGAASTTAAAAEASHTVKVGGDAGLVFQPDQLNDVPVGDTVVFEFMSQNHTVTQSGFDAPCVATDGGMDTGFMANPNNTVSPPPQVAMQVMAEEPLWFYCKQGTHCGEGMTFSVNPTADKTQAQFQQQAIAQNGTGEATPITGGGGGNNASDPAASTSSAAAGGATETGAVTPGQGTVNQDGSCSCVVSCASGSFPVDTQGIGATGGIAGSIPMNMAGLR